MDFKIKHSDIDSAISDFRSGIGALEDTIRQLGDGMQQFEGGGFTGQSGDLMNDLLQRKQKLVTDLRETYNSAVRQLQLAKKKSEEADQELKKRMSQIC